MSIIDLYFLVFKPRDNNVTCEFQPIDISTISIPTPTPTVTMPTTMSSNPTPSDSPGSTIVQQPLIGLNILITFTLLTGLVL